VNVQSKENSDKQKGALFEMNAVCILPESAPLNLPVNDSTLAAIDERTRTAGRI